MTPQPDQSVVAAVEAGLEVVERLMYGYDHDTGSYGLWDPQTDAFVIHCAKAETNLRPHRAEIIARYLNGAASDHEHAEPGS